LFQKPDHFQIPSNCSQTNTPSRPPPATAAPGAPILSPPKIWDFGGRGMLHSQEHPAVRLFPYAVAPGEEASHLEEAKLLVPTRLRNVGLK